MTSTANPSPTIEADAQMRLDDDGGPTLPPLIPAAPPLPARQCGRCRQLFDGDPTLYAGTLTEWWACPACRDALLPDRSNTPAAAARQPRVR